MRWLSATLWLCLGCGGASTAPDEPRQDRLHPHNLYPLKQGAAWAYDVDTGDGDPVLAVTKVVSVEGNTVQVSGGNRQLRKYELRPQGIFRPDSNTWLLKAPIAMETEWASTSGRTARVTSLDAEAQTEQGTLDGCVEITESADEPGLEVTTVYCPGVGPARVESYMSVRGQSVRVVATLRGHEVPAQAAESQAAE